ncbi:PREDICTED: 60S ribosomal protein L34-like [Acropora digitifera]|uniref:60S ribosomal protein L34-like n=1 Tax=Acropora digitifera TaxID=70779 RepID=UPI00077A45F5|nr:PREDICTED: 60S ribosomal protein L34-like [Acropora digitifera]
MVQRLTYRRRFTYNTKSNKRKISKTPGGKLVYLHVKKRGKVPKCGDCKCKLFGVSNSEVSGCFSLSSYWCLTEEQKIVVRVLKAQEEKKTASK